MKHLLRLESCLLQLGLGVDGRLLEEFTGRGEGVYLCGPQGVLASGIGKLSLVGVAEGQTLHEALHAWGVLHSRTGQAQVLIEPLEVQVDLLQCLRVLHQTCLVHLAPLLPFLDFKVSFRAFNAQLGERAT